MKEVASLGSQRAVMYKAGVDIVQRWRTHKQLMQGEGNKWREWTLLYVNVREMQCMEGCCCCFGRRRRS